MKLAWLFFLGLLIQGQATFLGATPRCIPLSKTQLQSLFEAPDKMIIVGNLRLSLNVPTLPLCEDCIVLVHTFPDTEIFKPLEDIPDINDSCIYHIGPNDTIHVHTAELRTRE